MHAFDSFRFYLPSPCVIDVVHVDRILGKISHIYNLVNVTKYRTQLFFSRIVNTRFIDKTINFTTAHCNNDFSTPLPPPKAGEGGEGRGLGCPRGARACALITLDVALITLDVPQSFRNSQYTLIYTVICYSHCATVSVQQSMHNIQCTTVNVQQSLSVDADARPYLHSMYTVISQQSMYTYTVIC